jgi:uncharacterized small protein (DUF1192 family)
MTLLYDMIDTSINLLKVERAEAEHKLAKLNKEINRLKALRYQPPKSTKS